MLTSVTSGSFDGSEAMCTKHCQLGCVRPGDRAAGPSGGSCVVGAGQGDVVRLMRARRAANSPTVRVRYPPSGFFESRTPMPVERRPSSTHTSSFAEPLCELLRHCTVSVLRVSLELVDDVRELRGGEGEVPAV